MKKFFICITSLFFFQVTFAQISIAVMDFQSGSNTTTNVSGLSDMLINSLYETGNFDIVERSQINYALQELGYQQGKNLSVTELTRMGKYLKVDYVLVGIVNFIATGNSPDPGFMEGEYNIDVRIVDVNTSRIVSTAGVTKSGNQTYRSLMPNLAGQLSQKLTASSIPCIQGYLYVYPEYLGKGTYTGAVEKADLLNRAYAGGRNTWRLPSIDELKAISENLELLKFQIDGSGAAYSYEIKFDPWASGNGGCTGLECYRVYYYQLNYKETKYNGGGKDDCWIILVSSK